MKIKITKQLPEWSEVKTGKRVVIVEFPNCSFKWMPSYRELAKIRIALKEIEEESWGKGLTKKQEDLMLTRDGE